MALVVTSERLIVSRSSRKHQPLSATVTKSHCMTSISCQSQAKNAIIDATRRDALVSLTSLPLISLCSPVFSARAEVEYATFFGLASPPTSYGGYGGNAIESPKYSFEYPSTWKSEVPNKVEKGTQGIDCRVVNPKTKGQRAFVITLTRAGEDNKSFRLTDIDSTFAGFAGADYQLQDALSSSTEAIKGQSTRDDTLFYTYDIDSPEFRYLASIAVKNGKIFAMFVKSPSKAFKSSESQLRHMIDTFTIL